jgi:hypothetical protein
MLAWGLRKRGDTADIAIRAGHGPACGTIGRRLLAIWNRTKQTVDRESAEELAIAAHDARQRNRGQRNANRRLHRGHRREAFCKLCVLRSNKRMVGKKTESHAKPHFSPKVELAKISDTISTAKHTKAPYAFTAIDLCWRLEHEVTERTEEPIFSIGSVNSCSKRFLDHLAFAACCELCR